MKKVEAIQNNLNSGKSLRVNGHMMLKIVARHSLLVSTEDRTHCLMLRS